MSLNRNKDMERSNRDILTRAVMVAGILLAAAILLTGMANAQSVSIVGTNTTWTGPSYNVTATYTLISNSACDVQLRIYDTGNNLVTIVNGGHKTAGTYDAVWNGRYDNGTTAPYGLYTLKVYATNGSLTSQPTGEWGGFYWPGNVAVDTAGNIYVADSSNNAIKKIDTTGTVTTIATGLNLPSGVDVDTAGNVYVADEYNNAVKKIDTTGTITTIADTGFNLPEGVDVDSTGNLYIADSLNNAVKKIDTTGTITTIADTGFNHPWGIDLDTAGNIYVADVENNAVKKIDTTGKVMTVIDGLSWPQDVAVDSTGNIYIADSLNNAIKKIDTTGTVTTIITGLSSPRGVDVDIDGNVYVSDMYNNAVKKYSTTGTTSDPVSVNVSPKAVCHLRIVPGNIKATLNSSRSFKLVLDSVPDGMAGYDLYVSLGDPSVASITRVSWPAWARQLHNSTDVSPGVVRISAADLRNRVKPGDDVILAKITVKCDQPGNTTISIRDISADDDNGSKIPVQAESGILSVKASKRSPDAPGYPTDADLDGWCEESTATAD